MSDLKIFESISEWIKFRAEIKGEIGFVPTMGALHQGHISLVKRSTEDNPLTLVSIYVNPTQFDDPGDLEKYPKTLAADVKCLQEAGADFLLLPRYEELYPDRFRYQLKEVELSKILCGKTRPGHFKGMLTVVLKLLNIAEAARAYFGEKDYQQFLLIKGMAEAFFLKTEIIGMKTWREADGLAMSSRNVNLKPSERELAKELPSLLKSSKSAEAAKVSLTARGFQVDYVEDLWGRRFGAVKIGSVRLIDNVEI